MKPTILAIDNDPLVLMTLKGMFQDEGIEVQTAISGEHGIALFQENPHRYAVVLLDYELKPRNGEGMNGDKVAHELKNIYSDVRIVMLSGQTTESVIQACLSAGAEQFIAKGSDISKVQEVVRSIIFENEDGAEESPDERTQKITRTLEMVGCSRELSKVADVVRRYAPFEEPVLILGESGSGKEGIAKAVHENSNRKGKNFVAINCGAVAKDVLESELFGHERGAFTGAIQKKIGLFEQASGGTVFLDEIGDMPMELQVKILRALQEKQIQPVGGKLRDVDFRIVAATHRNLKRAAEQGEFRQDLYYRLKYLTIELPPLRERPEDIEPLVWHFLSQIEEKTKLKKGITNSAMRKLKSYRWPGNVRELDGVIKRAFALSDGKIGADVLRSEMNDDPLSRLETLKATGEVIPHMDFLKLVEEAERWLLNRAMELSGNAKGAAATLLGMNHNTMNYRRTILGIEKGITLKKGGLK
jgi:DNA-binding NtrC family response regulator